jgi:hypothetical protein
LVNTEQKFYRQAYRLSLVYELTGFAYADVIGAAGLIYFSISEGKEAFEKAKGKEDICCK